MNQADAREIPALTGIRAYAALWVVLLHLSVTVGVSTHALLGPVATHGAWGVDVFFVLSGFILSLLYAPRFQAQGFAAVYRNYIVARFARIYPLHMFALLLLAVWVLWQRLGGEIPPANFGLRALALNLTLLHGWGLAEGLSWNYPSWSISTEWFAYLLLLPSLALGLQRRSAAACVLLAVALWALLCLSSASKGLPVREMTFSWAVPRIVAEFTLGYALYRVHERARLTATAADALVLAGGTALLALCFGPPSAEWLLAPAVAGLVLGLARAGPLGRAVFGNRVAVFWGERSYSIYMLHGVLIFFVCQAAMHFGLPKVSRATGWTLFLAVATLLPPISHLAYRWIELPMRGRLRSRLERP